MTSSVYRRIFVLTEGKFRWCAFAVMICNATPTHAQVSGTQVSSTSAELIAIPGGDAFTSVPAVSNDGSIVVGNQNENEAFRWTQSQGAVGLGDLPGGAFFSRALALSGDGSTVVGYSESTLGNEAFLWTQSGGMEGLGYLNASADNSLGSVATAVNSDGSVVVGSSESVQGGAEAFRWTRATGMVSLGFLPETGWQSKAMGVSGDGSVVVGWGDTAEEHQAFRWTQMDGMVGLGFLPGGSSFSQAHAISRDGLIIVGFSYNANGIIEAFRWTQTTGMTGLGNLPTGLSASIAWATNADGSVVVGGADSNPYAFFATSVFSPTATAFRWTQSAGMQPVIDWLSDNGVSTEGWIRLAVATGVNANGNVVVGQGVTANGIESFIARVGSATGIVGLTDLSSSLASTITTAQQLESLTALTFNGAHHRTLMDLAVARNGSCAWASADAGQVKRPYDGWMQLTEIGGCFDFADKTMRAGIGIGESAARQDQGYDGFSKIQGNYIIGELDWGRGTGAIVSVLAMSGRWDTYLKRSYSFGTSSSESTPDLSAHALRIRLDWPDAFRFRKVSFEPSIQLTTTHTKMAAYQERGGTAPAYIDQQKHSALESRAGLSSTFIINDVTTLRTSAQWVHRFDKKLAPIEGSADVLEAVSMPFNISGADVHQDWGRIGAEVVHRLNSKSVLSVSVNAANNGHDATQSAGITWKLSL